ncbi:tetratricopeptide repeat protein [Limnovirga soli]|uniref:Tetratricopeptide repeat protein n=1 Tax=Limnovirga soli TaxID=2656915 RepID=A0A8J8FFM3_9BACT|nr:hypothetical protein [Limnovirga soli]NNV57165.1 hypothetical protein [Limnovirga soli]
MNMQAMLKPFFTVVIMLCITANAMAQNTNKNPKPPTPKVINYDELKTEIADLFDTEAYDKLIPKANTYLQKRTNDTVVVFQLTTSYFINKQFKQGFDVMTTLYKNPDSAAKMMAIIPLVIEKATDSAIAIPVCTEAIRIAPNNPYGYFTKAAILTDLGHYPDALAAGEHFFGLLKTNDEKRDMGIVYATVLFAAGESEKAYNIALDLNKTYPETPAIMEELAKMYRSDRKYTEAISLLNRLVIIDPENASIALRRMYVYKEMGNPEKACEDANNINTKFEGYDFLYYQLKCPSEFAKPILASGTKYTWAVENNGSEYNFSVTLSNADIQKELHFNWEMTNSTDMTGEVSIGKEALANATILNNYFKGGMGLQVMNDATSTVWISKASYQSLIDNNETGLDVGEGMENFTVVADDEFEEDDARFEQRVNLGDNNDKLLECIHITNEEGSRQLWILKNSANPLIVKMDLGWTIELKKIEQLQ